MLQIKNISKKYSTKYLVQSALDDVSLTLRDNEFVAILGPSGSGKTTLLNIIGGLDRYDSGDLIINGISTKKYKDRDWDSYRNHTIGFVFQSYNLIPHQSILSNVELALTISGITKKERKRLSKEALEKVGLGNQVHKKPNQLSGGQMQRVAIARALVNNPEILLADEPTGALDTETSILVMDLLKEIAKDRLVIMVTHNPELAENYATRIVKLRDGKITDDSDPYQENEQEVAKPEHKTMGKTSMSFLTALSLSLNNLKTKKARTILTSFAGSIGIIGIALILALSSGINAYIETVQKDTLSTYPISIERESIDMTSMMTAMMEQNTSNGVEHELDKIYSNNIVTGMFSTLSEETKANDLGTFKEYIESGESKILDYVSTIQYGYDLDLQIYSSDTTDGILQLNPSELLRNPGMGGMSGMSGMSAPGMGMMSSNVFEEMLGNQELLQSQYDVLAGRFPAEGAYNEVVLVVDENNEISDLSLYSIGLMDQEEYKNIQKALAKGEDVKEPEQASFTYDEILKTSFKLVLNTDYYEYNKEAGLWKDMREDNAFMTKLVEDSLELKVVGILRPNPEASATSINGAIGYTSSLTEYIINNINNSDIAKAQLADAETNIFTNMPFDMDGYMDTMTMEEITDFVKTLSMEEQQQFYELSTTMTEEEIIATFGEQIRSAAGKEASYDSNIAQLGIVNLDKPSRINLYPTNFESKDAIADIIEDYNTMQKDAGHEEMTINYTDIVGLMMSSITTIIDMISYVLIGFVAISLVVSSIMIGIITYISVLERTKEIGILRSIGASKRNISSIFNAETLIIGFTSGLLGIGISLLLLIPINAIIAALSGISTIAVLPWGYAVVLVVISMILTLIAGLIPSKKAAKKDPVTALRSE
ncbi:ATP-binding cassette domain-containing protein [Lachnoclostridium phytofermentans]|uniref:ABC transporter ATP-binding protein/permease n=1 Tax=Lachnoclostridium phytofermentans TaxID=66219 RepID=UPI00049656B4|nr:ATP-binding cassette domain-containing protein [Lachnoclostridium phytofermentans]